MDKFDKLYMDIAIRISKMSFSNRSKVGSIIVKDNNIISFGWNGMPSGYPNDCEVDNITNIEVIHAEENAICKAAKQGININGSTIYLTLSPCQNCAKLLLQSGIKRVVFKEKYRILESIDFLKKYNISVEHFEQSDTED